MNAGSAPHFPPPYVTTRKPAELARDLAEAVRRYRVSGQAGPRHVSEWLLPLLVKLAARREGGEP